jgi:hypothetical protein
MTSTTRDPANMIVCWRNLYPLGSSSPTLRTHHRDPVADEVRWPSNPQKLGIQTVTSTHYVSGSVGTALKEMRAGGVAFVVPAWLLGAPLHDLYPLASLDGGELLGGWGYLVQH